MYKGFVRQDVSFLVRQTHCTLYNSTNGREWVEIFIPHSKSVGYAYGTIMVRTTQVRAVESSVMPDTWNEITVNRNAHINNSTKDRDTRTVLANEKMTPDIIIGALLRVELDGKVPYTPDYQLYLYFKNTGLTMLEYMLRVMDGRIDYTGRQL